MRVLPCKCGCNSGPDGRRGIAFAHSQSRKQKKNRISKVKQATKAIKMSVNVIPVIQRNIKENTEKLKYKKANEGQEVKEE